MTEQQLQIVLKIMEDVKTIFNHSIHDGEDMAQEAYLIALDVTKSYNKQNGKYENYVRVSIYNRLRNFIRREKTHDLLIKDEPQEKLVMVESQELSDLEMDINDNLSPEFRKDYLKFKAGAYLKYPQKKALIDEMKRLLHE
jgi:DNA-directed RNA polymerase specialized sigma24 family protein